MFRTAIHRKITLNLHTFTDHSLSQLAHGIESDIETETETEKEKGEGGERIKLGFRFAHKAIPELQMIRSQGVKISKGGSVCRFEAGGEAIHFSEKQRPDKRCREYDESIPIQRRRRRRRKEY